ncbi:unnamed protein product, partial [Urochloa humidicola]
KKKIVLLRRASGGKSPAAGLSPLHPLSPAADRASTSSLSPPISRCSSPSPSTRPSLAMAVTSGGGARCGAGRSCGGWRRGRGAAAAGGAGVEQQWPDSAAEQQRLDLAWAARRDLATEAGRGGASYSSPRREAGSGNGASSSDVGGCE